MTEEEIELSDRDDGVHVLSGLIRSLLEPHELDESVATIFDSCKSFIGAKYGFVALLDEESHESEIVYRDLGMATSDYEGELLTFIQGSIGRGCRRDIATYFNNLSDSAPSFPDDLPFDNLLNIPLMLDDEANGSLILLGKPSGFTDEDAEMAINFASILSIAVKTSQRKESPDYSQDSSERNATKKALEMANKKLNLLGSATRHDILNQLLIIVGYEGIIEGLVEDERISIYLSKLKGAVERINRLLEFQRDYENMGTEMPVWTRASDIVYLAISKLDTGRVRISVDLDGLDLFVDPLMEKVFYNLIHNSLNHGDGVNEIRIYMSEFEGHLMLIYEDDGKGIPERNKERIFNYGFGENTGQGLFLSREILRINDIDIRESGMEGSGVRFEMKIPPTHFSLASAES